MSETTIATETGAAIKTASRVASGVSQLRVIVLPLVLAFVVLGFWQAAVTAFNIPAVILPSPAAIGLYVVTRGDLLLIHAQQTTFESLAAFLLACLLGIALAVLITYSRLARDALYPNLVFFQLIPKIALAPLFVIWLGIGFESRVAFSVFIAFFPVVIATAAGLSSADKTMLRLCRSLTATEWQTFVHVRFPTAIPHMFSGFKIAVTLAIIGVIIGEFITSQSGLGYIIILATSRADTEMSMAAIAVLCICGLLLYGLVAAAEWVAIRIYRDQG